MALRAGCSRFPSGPEIVTNGSPGPASANCQLRRFRFQSSNICSVVNPVNHPPSSLCQRKQGQWSDGGLTAGATAEGAVDEALVVPESGPGKAEAPLCGRLGVREDGLLEEAGVLVVGAALGAGPAGGGVLLVEGSAGALLVELREALVLAPAAQVHVAVGRHRSSRSNSALTTPSVRGVYRGSTGRGDRGNAFHTLAGYTRRRVGSCNYESRLGTQTQVRGWV